MQTLKKILVLISGLALLALFPACKDQGPAERAGEKIDTVMEKTQEQMKETADTMDEQIEKAGDAIDENVDKAGKKMEETGEKMQ